MGFDFVNSRVLGLSGAVTASLTSNGSSSLSALLYVSGTAGAGKVYVANGIIVSASGCY